MITSAIIGILLGFISTRAFFPHSWVALLPWALVGLATPLAVKDKKQQLWAGALYGFFLSLTFLITGFQGSSSKLPIFILFSLLLSLFGALCGLALAYISTWIKKS